MSSEWTNGAPAFITIAEIAALSVFYFAFYLKDPENLGAATTVAKDRGSAHAKTVRMP